MRTLTVVFSLLALTACDSGTSNSTPPMADAGVPLDAEPADSALDMSAVLDLGTMVDAAFPTPTSIVVGSYNVQNLYDTTRDPGVDEGDFTPSANGWNARRLSQRLSELARVFKAMNADLVSVTEVESLEVLEALRDAIAAEGGPEYPWAVVSPTRDPRGIRIGFLSRYPITSSGGRPINMEYTCQGQDGPVMLGGTRPEARPILQVEVDLTGDQVGDMVLFANHWKAKTNSSRPCQDVEHRRRAAQQLRGVIDDFIAEDPTRPLIAIGDFNSFEFDVPLKTDLGAVLDPTQATEPEDLYNAWGEAGVIPRNRNDNQWNDATNSSYNFRNNWTRLDHILLTGNMHPAAGASQWRWIPGSAETVHPDFVLTNRGHPRSWYFDSGEGFSDHLAIQVRLRFAPE